MQEQYRKDMPEHVAIGVVMGGLLLVYVLFGLPGVLATFWVVIIGALVAYRMTQQHIQSRATGSTPLKFGGAEAYLALAFGVIIVWRAWAAYAAASAVPKASDTEATGAGAVAAPDTPAQSLQKVRAIGNNLQLQVSQEEFAPVPETPWVTDFRVLSRGTNWQPGPLAPPQYIRNLRLSQGARWEQSCPECSYGISDLRLIRDPKMPMTTPEWTFQETSVSSSYHMKDSKIVYGVPFAGPPTVVTVMLRTPFPPNEPVFRTVVAKETATFGSQKVATFSSDFPWWVDVSFLDPKNKYPFEEAVLMASVGGDRLPGLLFVMKDESMVHLEVFAGYQVTGGLSDVPLEHRQREVDVYVIVPNAHCHIELVIRVQENPDLNYLVQR